jgi:sulfatase modifying factor 1
MHCHGKRFYKWNPLALLLTGPYLPEPTMSDEPHCCCTPASPATGVAAHRTRALTPQRRGTTKARHALEQCRVPAQTFEMGDSHGDGRAPDGEGPVHAVELDSFEIDATTVTNGDFGRFVDATGYQTDAERFGSSAVFHLAVAAPAGAIRGAVAAAPWWLAVDGADWAHPDGPESDVDGRDDHPVVHVSFADAQAYCAWAGRSLPSEAQWEAASRGGIARAKFPWGDAINAKRANIWHGTFPTANTLDDGYLTTAPVHSYDPNGYGLWQTVGNVWEWCADWWDPRYYTRSPRHDPRGPASGQTKVLRGGSYLCHDSYCNRYRNAARSSNTPDSSMANAGFRTVSRSV